MKNILKICQEHLFFILMGGLLLLILPFIPIFDGDTFYYIAKAKHMLLTGDFFNTSTFMVKPILGLWVMMLSYKLFGVSLFSTYIWHTLFSIGTVWLVYRFAREFASERAAYISAAVLASSLMFFYQTCSPMLDIPMIFFLTLTQYWLFKYFKTSEDKYIYLFNVGCGLNFLTKGLMAAVIPMATYVLYYLLKKENPIKAYLKVWWKDLIGIVLLLLIVSIWLVPQFQAHGPEFGKALYRENIERFFHPIDETGGYRQVSSSTQRDPYLNILYLLLAFLPWSALLIPMFVSAYKEKYWGEKDLVVFLMAWFYFIFFITTVSGHYKGPRYLLPLIPALALLTGVYLDYIWDRSGILLQKTTYRTFYGIGIFLGLVTIYCAVTNFTHGENAYKPLIVPFLLMLTLVQFIGAQAWKQGLFRRGVTGILWGSFLAYTIFLTAGNVYLKQLLPEYSVAGFLRQEKIIQPITVWKIKIHSLDFYLNQDLNYISQDKELKAVKVGYIIAENSEEKTIKERSLKAKQLYQNSVWTVWRI